MLKGGIKKLALINSTINSVSFTLNLNKANKMDCSSSAINSNKVNFDIFSPLVTRVFFLSISIEAISVHLNSLQLKYERRRIPS